MRGALPSSLTGRRSGDLCLDRERRRVRLHRGCPPFQPRADVVGNAILPGGPASNLSGITVDHLGESPLRPAEDIQAFAESVRGHGGQKTPILWSAVTSARTSPVAAPTVAMASAHGARPWSRRDLSASAASFRCSAKSLCCSATSFRVSSRSFPASAWVRSIRARASLVFRLPVVVSVMKYSARSFSNRRHMPCAKIRSNCSGTGARLLEMRKASACAPAFHVLCP